MPKSNAIRRAYWRLRETMLAMPRRVRCRVTRVAFAIRDYWTQIRVLWLFFYSNLRLPFFTYSPLLSPKDAVTPKTLLIISFYSPPYVSSLGTQRIAKFMKFLSREGWKTILLTTAPEPGDLLEAEDIIPDGIRVVRLPAAQVSRFFRNHKRFVPDDFITWVLPAYRAGLEIVRSEHPAAILATAPPYSNLLIGTILGEKMRIPLVADFRDPWSRIDIGWTLDNPILRWINERLERVVLTRGARIIMADDLEYVDQFFVDPGLIRGKVESITNGYDEEDFQDIRVRPLPGKFRVSYIGLIYDEETFEHLIAPFRIWADRYPEDLKEVVFAYAGLSSRYFSTTASLPFTLEDHGYVSHRQAIELRFGSNLQLFCLPRYFKPHVYSGKIFEIIRTPVPVLAITRPDGAVARLVARTNAGVIVAPDDAQTAAMYLKEYFDRWRRGESAQDADPAIVREYSRERLARRLSKLLDAVHGIVR